MGVQVELNWCNVAVDMPNMGPGADRAGWWVEYLEELTFLGKYEAILQYLAYAKRSRALEIINKAHEQVKRARVEDNRSKSGVQKAVTRATLPGPKKTSLPTKSEPYFYTKTNTGTK